MVPGTPPNEADEMEFGEESKENEDKAGVDGRERFYTAKETTALAKADENKKSTDKHDDDGKAKEKKDGEVLRMPGKEDEDDEAAMDVHEDAGSDEGPGSDLEDLFLDAVGEIQRASIALNAGLRGASSSKLGTTLEESYREFVEQPVGDAEKPQPSSMKPETSTEEAKVSQNDKLEEA